MQLHSSLEEQVKVRPAHPPDPLNPQPFAEITTGCAN